MQICANRTVIRILNLDGSLDHPPNLMNWLLTQYIPPVTMVTFLANPFIYVQVISLMTDKITEKQRNKETKKKRNKQTNKQTNKTSKQANKHDQKHNPLGSAKS